MAQFTENDPNTFHWAGMDEVSLFEIYPENDEIAFKQIIVDGFHGDMRTASGDTINLYKELSFEDLKNFVDNSKQLDKRLSYAYHTLPYVAHKFNNGMLDEIGIGGKIVFDGHQFSYIDEAKFRWNLRTNNTIPMIKAASFKELVNLASSELAKFTHDIQKFCDKRYWDIKTMNKWNSVVAEEIAGAFKVDVSIDNIYDFCACTAGTIYDSNTKMAFSRNDSLGEFLLGVLSLNGMIFNPLASEDVAPEEGVWHDFTEFLIELYGGGVNGPATDPNFSGDFFYARLEEVEDEETGEIRWEEYVPRMENELTKFVQKITEYSICMKNDGEKYLEY